MNWMVKWAGPFPLFLESASGAHATCADGHDYVDLCLGDTGAMAGHGPAPVIAAVERQLRRGITTMLPTEDAAWVGAELARRFGLPSWQFTLTATDANRFSLRIARAITGRPFVAVHEWCYHGSVDETFAVLDGAPGDPFDRRHVVARRGNLGPQVDPARTTRVVPYNDLDALDARAPRWPGRRAPHRAGAHQRRDRAAGPRLPRGRSRDHPPPRHDPHPRRDPHDLRRTRRHDRRRRLRAGHARDRQDHRRRRFPSPRTA